MTPTSVRNIIAGLLTLMACLLYLDRYAVGIASESMREDLGMTQTQMSWFLSAFFWSYALSQVPAGFLSDRFGPRSMLTVYILGWSLFTGLLGVTYSVAVILLLRFLCGAAQAGAYPVASGLIRSWFPISRRGIASSAVAMGGRSGAVLAPILTAALMTAFSKDWRPVLILYGLAGIVVALAVGWCCRDTPQDHSLCNDAERNFIAGDATESGPPSAASLNAPFPWTTVLTSLSLWGNSLTQLLTNIGWLFMVTWLPRYLGDVHKVPLQEQAVMTAIPTAAGIAGMFCGGWSTDAAVRRFGLKWGRRLPVVLTRFVSAAGYGLCFLAGTFCLPDSESRWLPWTIVAGLSLCTFSCDLGIPAIWAYSQDVGGQFTASIMGWSNMWGNIGAAIAPLIYNGVLGETPSTAEWNSLFALCAGVFTVAGISASVIDSTKRITAPESIPAGFT